MKRSLWFSPLALVLLLAACGDVTGPAPAEIEVAVWGGAWEANGAAFLPPVGRSVDTAGFDPGVTVEVKIVELDGTPVSGAQFTTADGSVRVEDDFYMAVWDVGRTARANRDLSEVRVEVWVSDLSPTSDLATACGADEPCLAGSFEAVLKKNKRRPASPTALDLTTTQSLPIKFFVSGTGALRPTSLSELHRLGEPTSFFEDVAEDEPYPNCTVNEFTMPAQGFNALGSGFNALGSGFNALGSVGGMFLFGPGTEPGAPSVRMFPAGEAGERTNGLLTDDLERNAAILIVDDFGGIVSAGISGVYELDGDLIDPADDLNEAGLRALIEGGGFSHGALVLHQTLEMVEAAGFTANTSYPWTGAGDFHVYERQEDDGDGSRMVYLVVAAVDTDGFDSDVIPTRIQNALNALRYYGFLGVFNQENETFDLLGLDIGHVAINMSFAIVPCSILDDFDASELPDFEAYRDALGADNGVADDFYDELTSLLLSPLGADPVLDQVTCDEGSLDLGYEYNYDANGPTYDWATLVMPPEDNPPYLPVWGCASRSTVYVASSGNFGLDYSMYPAAWPLVLAVGAQDGIGTTPADGFSTSKSDFSNSAEVMAPGSILQLGTSSSATRALGYIGTSFASPVAALYSALDLMQDAPDCTGPTYSYLTSEDDVANTVLEAAVANCPGNVILY